MSYSSEKRIAQEERAKEREIKIFNENLKTSPKLDDELFLYENMHQIRLKLKQIPTKHYLNILLMKEYFQYTREQTNYKLIPKEILNNKIFLRTAIIRNPELLFMVNEENKSLFKELAIKSDNEYLKYFNKEDFSIKENIHKVSFNMDRFNESLSCFNAETLKNYIDGQYAEYVWRSILKMSKERLFYLKDSLREYIESNKEKRGEYWFKDVLEKNPYIYSILDKDKYKSDKDKGFLIELTGKYHDIFPLLPKEWKEDLTVIEKVINNTNKTSSNFQFHGTNYHNNVKNISIILNEYPDIDNFLNKHKENLSVKALRNIYTSLNENWKKQEFIVKSLFKLRDDYEVSLDFCRSIPIEPLSNNLVDYLKSCKMKRLENIGEDLEKIVNHYYLSQKLEIKATSEKKLKI